MTLVGARDGQTSWFASHAMASAVPQSSWTFHIGGRPAIPHEADRQPGLEVGFGTQLRARLLLGVAIATLGVLQECAMIGVPSEPSALSRTSAQ